MRIQSSGKDWKSFTIHKSRKSEAKTEFDKLIKAQAFWFFNAEISFVCYLDKDDYILAVYRVKTLDLLIFIGNGFTFLEKKGIRLRSLEL
mgnify:CR=1 FL=1